MRVAVVLAAAVMPVVSAVRQQSLATSLAGGFHVGGASLSNHSSASAWIPGSSSLTQTPAVMCIAETSTRPSRTPASSTASWTSSVMRMNSRRSGVWKVRYFVCAAMGPESRL